MFDIDFETEFCAWQRLGDIYSGANLLVVTHGEVSDHTSTALKQSATPVLCREKRMDGSLHAIIERQLRPCTQALYHRQCGVEL